jgi:hypothetical protein
VTISGTKKVGQVLTANPSGFAPAPAYTYQWFRGDIAIGLGKAQTYTLVAADAGKQISVRVTAKLAGYEDKTVTSDPTAAITAPGGDAANGTWSNVGSPKSGYVSETIIPFKIARTTPTGPVTATYASASLPPGLVINSSTGEISGKYSKAGTYQTVVTATLASGKKLESPTITWTVQENKGAWTNMVLVRSGFVGGTLPAVKINVVPLNKVAVQSYAVKAGTSLPRGLKINSAGEISGKFSEPGSYQAIITATLQDGTKLDSSTITWTVKPNKVSWAKVSATRSGIVGLTEKPIEVRAASLNGVTVKSYSVKPGNPLPPGLKINSTTGDLSGKFTKAGNYSSVLIATLQDGTTYESGTTKWTVWENKGIWNDTSARSGTVGVTIAPVNLTMIATNQVKVQSYAVKPGNPLPPGLKISANGEISGKYSQAGIYSTVITATLVDGTSLDSPTIIWTVK